MTHNPPILKVVTLARVGEIDKDLVDVGQRLGERDLGKNLDRMRSVNKNLMILLT